MRKDRKKEKNMSENMIKELFTFIEKSPTAFHAVDTMKEILEAEGYEPVLERQDWDLQVGGKYYVMRNGTSLIAFRVPTEKFSGFQMMASHSDSPTFRIKENPEMNVGNAYVKLNVEGYGGMICSSWLDRPLSVAGRLIVKTKEGIKSCLVNVDRDLLMIPSLAIHINRKVNEEQKFNVQKDLLPLYGMGEAKESFLKVVAAEAGVEAKDILGHDLFLYSRVPGTIWGANKEFISSSRLDDLQCVFGSLKGFLAAEDKKHVPVHCVFDNEEVGSSTKQGAASTFLADTLLRICEAFGKTSAGYRQAIANSFMVSADNAHAVHPNYEEKACPTNRPVLNGGVVIKYSANQKYTTDGVTAALFKTICERAEIPYQVFLNRSDMPGGSTLGNISANQVAVRSVDIGMPQLAMHSAYETAGAKDTEYLVKVAKTFFESTIKELPGDVYRI